MGRITSKGSRGQREAVPHVRNNAQGEGDSPNSHGDGQVSGSGTDPQTVDHGQGEGNTSRYMVGGKSFATAKEAFAYLNRYIHG